MASNVVDYLGNPGEIPLLQHVEAICNSRILKWANILRANGKGLQGNGACFQKFASSRTDVGCLFA